MTWTGYCVGDHMLVNSTVERRMDKLKKFIQWPIGPRILDIGERNAIGVYLGATENSTGNLNYRLGTLLPAYDTIFDFEVLEHLMNPLQHLIQVREKLAPNGRLYLSTPLCPPLNRYIEKRHFAEYKIDRLMALFEEAGFHVVRQEIFPLIPFSLTGIRPMFKWMMWKTLLVELKPVWNTSASNS